MGNIALLVSRKDMLYHAHNILQEKQYHIDTMEVISTGNAVSKARDCIAKGSTIIISRGLQALLIRQYTNVPVVEIAMTPRELDTLIHRAKKIVGKEEPKIAIIGTKNMFPDMSYAEAAHHIRMKVYFAGSYEDFHEMAERAAKDGADIILGGDVAVSKASCFGIQSLFLFITEDSLRAAFDMAESMWAAIQTQKEYSGMEKIMDYSFHGVMRLDSFGRIELLNKTMDVWLDRDSARYIGKHIKEIFREISKRELEDFAAGAEDTRFYLIKYRNQLFNITLAKLNEADMKQGYILSCIRREKTDAQTAGEVIRGRVHFSDISAKSRSMKAFLGLAGRYAISDYPIYLEAPVGTESYDIACAIHNASPLQEYSFFSISSGHLESDMQSFFEKCERIRSGKKGTIHIGEIENLSKEKQDILVEWMTGTAPECRGLHFRFILSSGYALEDLYQTNRIRDRLYYLLNALVLRLPKLRERREDLEDMVEKRIAHINEKYFRYHRLTKGGKKAIMDYDWEGNTLSLYAFLERVLLASPKRNIDEIDVHAVLQELYPERRSEEGPKVRSATHSAKAGLIRDALIRNRFNREKTAKELGISKATLWRNIKKFGIVSD